MGLLLQTGNSPRVSEIAKYVPQNIFYLLYYLLLLNGQAMMLFSLVRSLPSELFMAASDHHRTEQRRFAEKGRVFLNQFLREEIAFILEI